MKHAAQLRALAHASPWFMPLLKAGASLGLKDWCIGAGAVRTLVWDALHGRTMPPALADVDFVYFLHGAENEEELELRLSLAAPGIPWEVTNQATVHRWYAAQFGRPIAPIPSLEAGVAGWPEFATCVGLALHGGDVRVVAPHGLEDLFAMRVRRNPASVSKEEFAARLAQKRFSERWPQVRTEMA
ncbi:nucleotidyltransferase family protein [Massilia endophytica]|uniref:nucleotidyltransferase family protein n=1 Tax=Massilia endophytica TaxID=2899220 RepID=UPI001E5A6365|nr:nucleotidyltransferase family protein [Massilia endophytica]UGQ45014.1 nucleotidyltransferase family protein [Massilia endophytica]